MSDAILTQKGGGGGSSHKYEYRTLHRNTIEHFDLNGFSKAVLIVCFSNQNYHISRCCFEIDIANSTYQSLEDDMSYYSASFSLGSTNVSVTQNWSPVQFVSIYLIP